MQKHIKILIDSNIYYDCSVTSNVIGKVYKNSIIIYDKKINGWYRIAKKAWVYTYNQSGKVVSETKESVRSPKGRETPIDYFEKAIKENSLDPKIDLQMFGFFSRDYEVEIKGKTYKGYFAEDYPAEIIDKFDSTNSIIYVESEEWHILHPFSKYGIPLYKNDIIYLEYSRGYSTKEAINYLLTLNGSEDGEEYMKELGLEQSTDKGLIQIGNALKDTTAKLIGFKTDSSVRWDIQNLYAIFGMPYQFMPTVDMRVPDDPAPPDDKDGSIRPGSVDNFPTIGIKFADKIVARMPLLVLIPGAPDFLNGNKDLQKEAIGIMAQNGGLSDLGMTAFSSHLHDEGNRKFYGLKFATKDYYRYVDSMCQTASVFMNLGNVKVDNIGGSLSSAHWGTYKNGGLSRMLCYNQGVAFYVNSDSQISESISNSPTQSQLAEKINGFSDMAREMQFMLGTASNLAPLNAGTLLSQKTYSEDSQTAGMLEDKIVSNGILGSLAKCVDTVLAGGKLIFPQIWGDSQFSRDYTIDIKLVSPDCDDFSIYMNIIVPLIHLMCFAMPRASGPNGYISPFLVRAFYKSFFSIDMGLITSMSINKGAEAAWNSSGVPTIVDVNLTIKELYDTMALANDNDGNKGGYTLSDNVSLLDYLSNLCGININEPDFARTVRYKASRIKNRVLSTFRTPSDIFHQAITNKMAAMSNYSPK